MFQRREPKPSPVPGASDAHRTCKWCGGNQAAAPLLPSRAQSEATPESCAGWLKVELSRP